MKQYFVVFFLLLPAICAAGPMSDYNGVAAVANSCYDSFGEFGQLGKTLVDQTMVVDHKYSGSLDGYSEQDKKDLVIESRQIRLNNFFHRIRVFNALYNRTNNGLIESVSKSKDPAVIQALKISDDLFLSENVKPLSVSDKLGVLRTVNQLTTSINRTCRDHHATYAKLLEKFGPMASNVGGAWKPMLDEVEKGAKGAGIFEIDIMNTPLSFMLSIKSDLHDAFGEYDSQSCVENGTQLNTVARANLVDDSIPQVENQFREIIAKLTKKSSLDPIDLPDEVLKNLLRNSPNAVRDALVKTASPRQTRAVCSIIHEMQNLYTAKQITMPIFIIGSTAIIVASGPFAGEVGTAFSVIFLAKSAKDVHYSYVRDDTIQKSLLASQIDSPYGQQILANVRNERAWSYANMILSGLGATVGIIRMAQIAEINPNLSIDVDAPDGWNVSETVESGYSPSTPKAPTNGDFSGGVDVAVKNKVQISSSVWKSLKELNVDGGDRLGTVQQAGVTNQFSLKNLSTTKPYTIQAEPLPIIQFPKQQRQNKSALIAPKTKSKIEIKNEKNNNADSDQQLSYIDSQKNESDSETLSKALNDPSRYKEWLEDRAKECEASEDERRFGDEICQLIIDVVAGRYEGRKGFILALSPEDDFLKASALDYDDSMFVAFKLPNGKYLFVIAIRVTGGEFPGHNEIYEKIKEILGNLKYSCAGQVLYVPDARYPISLAQKEGSAIETHNHFEMKPITKEERNDLQDVLKMLIGQ